MAATRLEQPKKHREVGFTKVHGNKLLTYNKVPIPKDGWVNANHCLPLRCDMMHLLNEDGRETIGWWAGAYWYGPKVRETDVIVKWKIMVHEYD